MRTFDVLVAVAAAAAAGSLLAGPSSSTARLHDLDLATVSSPGPRPSARPRRGRRRGQFGLRPRQEGDRNRRALEAFLDALTAQALTGTDLRSATAVAAAGNPLLDHVRVAAATPYGDVPAALERLANRRGAGAAADLALVWRVCEQTGAPLAAPVRRLLAAHRARERLRRQVTTELAGPTATAHLLAALPGLGLLMGSALGGDPVGFLLGTPVGVALLVGGAALATAGLVWTRAIARSVLARIGPT